MSLLGQVRVARPYYHCAHCGHGHVPLDQEVGLTDARLTPAAAEVACLAGVQTSFAQAAKTNLKKMCGLQLAESTVGGGVGVPPGAKSVRCLPSVLK